jgi:thiol-disulfide isomerase/thioredoxin
MRSWTKIKSRVLIRSAAAILLLAAPAIFVVADSSSAEPTTPPVVTTVQMQLVPSMTAHQLGYYIPQQAQLSPTQSDTITKLPPDLKHPLFAQLKIKGAPGAVYHVIVDEPANGPHRLFVDASGNGDLSDVTPVTWTGRQRSAQDSNQIYQGSATINLGTAQSPYAVTMQFYRFDPHDPNVPPSARNVILYYPDYAVRGEMTVAGKTYATALFDVDATGNFRSGRDLNNGSGGIKLFIDLDGTGRINPQFNLFNTNEPFNLDGTTYELSNIAKNGLSFDVVKSDRSVAARVPPFDHAPGKNVIAFQATTMDGKLVNFPADYHGHLVMLDFWATWCGPCMGEVPGLVKAYDQLHGQGFDVLGISLDNPSSAAKVRDITKQNGMTWPQVYDGKGWQAAIAVKYNIQSIPAPILVDADTGKILASDDQLRGESLVPTLKAELDKKNHVVQ